MSEPRGPGNFGTVYFPERDTAAVPGNGAVPPGQIARLPRKRRPMMIVVAALLVGIGILISVAMYQRANRQVEVLVVARPVAQGSVISSSDLSTASIAATGVSYVPASQLGQVTGLVAGSALHPGMLLAASDLVSSLPPPAGKVIVGLSLRPSALPASGLTPGDRVTIVATPGVVGTTGASAANHSLTYPVFGVVESVDAKANQDGNVVVDMLVNSSAGTALIEQDSTEQLGLILTKQAPR